MPLGLREGGFEPSLALCSATQGQGIDLHHVLRIGGRKRISATSWTGIASFSGIELPAVMLQKSDHLAAETEILRILYRASPGTRPWQRDLEFPADVRLRTVRHEQNPIGYVERLIDVVRHQDHRLRLLLP